MARLNNFETLEVTRFVDEFTEEEYLIVPIEHLSDFMKEEWVSKINKLPERLKHNHLHIPEICLGSYGYVYLYNRRHLAGSLDSSPYCMDCDIDTIDTGNYYMVKDEIWYKVVGDHFDGWNGMICIPCLEKRLGRELAEEDFTSAPINNKIVDQLDERNSRLSRQYA